MGLDNRRQATGRDSGECPKTVTYVKDVERSSKYMVRPHDIFAYNFLNMQLIKYYICRGMLEVLKIEITFDPLTFFNIDSM